MSNAQQKNYYQILGLPQSATDRQIGAAYRALAIKHHPDSSHEDTESDAEFKQIAEAYDVLSDPDKRRRYDLVTRKPKSGRTSRVPRGSQVSQEESLYRNDPIGIPDFWHGIIGDLTGVGTDPVYRTKSPTGRSPPGLIEGELPVTPEEAKNGSTVLLTVTTREQCSCCSGCADEQGEVCRMCDGGRFVAQRQSISVTLPDGIADGSYLHLRGVSGNSKMYDVQLRVRIQPSW
jgi:DnaJ-class molecular chaperone